MQVVTYRRKAPPGERPPADLFDMAQQPGPRRDPEILVLPAARMRERARNDDLQVCAPRRLLYGDLRPQLAPAIRSGGLHTVLFLNSPLLPSVDICRRREQEHGV